LLSSGNINFKISFLEHDVIHFEGPLEILNGLELDISESLDTFGFALADESGIVSAKALALEEILEIGLIDVIREVSNIGGVGWGGWDLASLSWLFASVISSEGFSSLSIVVSSEGFSLSVVVSSEGFSLSVVVSSERFSLSVVVASGKVSVVAVVSSTSLVVSSPIVASGWFRSLKSVVLTWSWDVSGSGGWSRNLGGSALWLLILG